MPSVGVLLDMYKDIDIVKFSEKSCHSWSRHIINCLAAGLARAIPKFTSPWSFHTALASSGCMKDLWLVNLAMVLALSQ